MKANWVLLSLAIGTSSFAADVLRTPSYLVTINDERPEGHVGSDHVKLQLIDLKTDKTLSLVGRTVHRIGRDGVTPTEFLGYEFINEETHYVIRDESDIGLLIITSKAQPPVQEEGKWTRDVKPDNSEN